MLNKGKVNRLKFILPFIVLFLLSSCSKSKFEIAKLNHIKRFHSGDTWLNAEEYVPDMTAVRYISVKGYILILQLFLVLWISFWRY